MNMLTFAIIALGAVVPAVAAYRAAIRAERQICRLCQVVADLDGQYAVELIHHKEQIHRLGREVRVLGRGWSEPSRN